MIDLKELSPCRIFIDENNTKERSCLQFIVMLH